MSTFHAFVGRVDFRCRPEHKAVRAEVIESIASRFSVEPPYRPTTREVVQWEDGTWTYRWEATLTPAVEHSAQTTEDHLLAALTWEGITDSDQDVRVR